MKSRLSRLARIERIEEKLAASASEQVYVSMRNNVVRVDKFRKRGVAQEFDTVKEAADWVDNRIKDSEQVRGIISVEDFTMLFDTEIREALDAAMTIAPRVSNPRDGSISWGAEERWVHLVMAYVDVARPLPGIARVAFGMWLERNKDCLAHRGTAKFTLLYILAQELGVGFPKITEQDYSRLYAGIEDGNRPLPEYLVEGIEL